MLPYQVRRELVQSLRISLGEFALDDDVFAFQITELLQFPDERRDEKASAPELRSPILNGCCACAASGQVTAK